MTWLCGMDNDCINTERGVAIDSDLGPQFIQQQETGIHESYEDMRKCLHSKEPAALRMLNLI